MPRRKPASARQNRETRDIGLVRLQKQGVPACPTLDKQPMSAEVRKVWETFWKSDVSGLVVDADRPALDRLFECYELRARMLATFMAEPFSTGSTGQTVVHPAAKEMASLDVRIKDLEDRFGITPAGRLKLGIVLGAAAKSLEEMNARFTGTREEDASEEGDTDPRLGAINTTAAG